MKPNIAAATSYDSAMILFGAIGRAGIGGAAIRSELAKTGYAGVSNPIIEFDANREIKNPAFEAKIVRDGQAVPYPEN